MAEAQQEDALLWQLRASRRHAKSSITRMYTRLVSNSQDVKLSTLSILQSRRLRIIELFVEYENYNKQIMAYDEYDREDVADFEAKYFSILATLNEAIKDNKKKEIHLEHGYKRKIHHIDHSYYKTNEDACEITETRNPVFEHQYAKKIHNDHSYWKQPTRDTQSRKDLLPTDVMPSTSKSIVDARDQPLNLEHYEHQHDLLPAELQVPSAYRPATNTSRQATKTSKRATNTSKRATNTSKRATNYSKQATNTSMQATNTFKQATNTFRQETNTSTQAPIGTSQAPIIQSIVEEPDHSFGIDLLLDNYDDHEDEAVDDCFSISDASCQEEDDDLSFYLNLPKKCESKDDNEQVLPEPNEDLHEGFMCNNCSGDIKGYRYTCVQCPDYDLCGSCEARGAHCLHYVLRIPRPKPYAEIQSVVHKIRQQLMYGVDIIVPSAPRVGEEHEIKEEVKEEGDPLEIDFAPTEIHEDDIIYTEEFRNDVQITEEENTFFTENVSNFVPDVKPKPKQKIIVTSDTILRNAPTNKTTERRSTPSVYTTTRRHALDTVINITPPDHTKLIKVASPTTRFTASTSQTSDGNTVLTLASQEPIKRPNEVYTMSKNAQATENPPKKLKVVFTPLSRGVEAGGRLGLTSENSPGAENSARSRRQFTDIDPLDDNLR